MAKREEKNEGKKREDKKRRRGAKRKENVEANHINVEKSAGWQDYCRQ